MRNPIVDCSSILVARLPRMGLAKALYSSTYSTGVEGHPWQVLKAVGTAIVKKGLPENRLQHGQRTSHASIHWR
jgi:hypothetical protein